ncbi:FMN-binding protein [Noviherbaspirillum autotrophicum]|uniref:FMN-binding protein n=1 Tax=Noviherbaspirillum autotrophicum TaxID=709839 RepID=A0A0C2BLK4_9BURK|nr:FMN-binding protein [Noviherbaspirillum autotrophicum]KIF82135.1 FMN-binding protein [Noviherbaspirillum autotrophicum]
MKSLHLATLAAAAAASGSAFATQYLTVEQAQHAIFPDATRFADANLQLAPEQMRQVEKLAGLPARSVNWRVFAAYRGDALLGHMVLDDVIGKFELISYAVGVNPDASIKQVEILTYRESHGFEIKSPAWRRQFAGKTVQSGLVVGEGIANISGATLSCNHVTDGVRRIAAIAQVILKK